MKTFSEWAEEQSVEYTLAIRINDESEIAAAISALSLESLEEQTRKLTRQVYMELANRYGNYVADHQDQDHDEEHDDV